VLALDSASAEATKTLLLLAEQTVNGMAHNAKAQLDELLENRVA
jgi:hypothetical protein